jgi:hypothetical protein
MPHSEDSIRHDREEGCFFSHGTAADRRGPLRMTGIVVSRPFSLGHVVLLRKLQSGSFIGYIQAGKKGV